MKTPANPVCWSAWGLAVALVTISTRNPLYLVLALIATTIVYLTRVSDSPDSATWRLVVRIGAVVAVVSVLFNLLTAHAGEDVLFHLPHAIPIVGGIITFNALLYGVSTAVSIVTLIIAAATFGSMVDRATLLRAVPYPLSSAGVAAIIGLSFFPQMIFAFHEVRDAQASRGFKVRSIRDVAPLVVPTLFLGLEHAFNLAEAMESRGFGASIAPPRRGTWFLPVGVVMMLAAISLTIGGQVGLALGAGAIGLLSTGYGLFGYRGSRVTYRPTRWTVSDLVVLGVALISGCSFAAAVVVAPASVEWSSFPRLIAPPFSPWLGLACVLLIAPALVGGATN
ncbi:MAG TPA: energy-coupling factor transporter transmembrane component T [Nitrolancea sp.]|nr:energy-coupling factor transporter transmembrane component T [Nitrolancea sp.]